ncbi:Citron Rho-interacting kinase [Schistosoma japonicum]|nr:Citron Rho-interacting kinase [Schistosoma japonicum]KAH8850611.1 Citron Rho-interacting kinase [Schistosoma japonicum]KAH8850612.1 Citron Rho-interacting kinase [Schistosoma japonicum]
MCTINKYFFARITFSLLIHFFINNVRFSFRLDMDSPIKPIDNLLLSSTPHHWQVENKNDVNRIVVKANLDSEVKANGVTSPQDKCMLQSKAKVRNSIDNKAHSEDPLRLDWTSQRASYLFDLLIRPPLLFSPSMGISLSLKKESQNEFQILPVDKRNRPVDPDPCLLSIDGLLDCLFVTNSLVDQIYHDCMDNPDNRATDEYEQSPTVLAAKFFRRRVKPIITRLSELRLKLSDFKLGACVGRGACGIVRVVREVSPPHSVYAMKSQFKGAWLHHDPEGSQILLERTVLAQATAIENPWLPHLHYAFQDEKHLHLVMDYEPGGDLYIFLSKVGHLLDSKMIQFYAAEAVEAVHSLHQMGYIHCDLKPENFAIERSGHLKLIDFGSAIRLDADGKCICPTMVGTKEYLNIELLRQRGRHNQEPLLVGPEFDYWAIGVLLYELFYGQTPFYDEDDDAMMRKIMDYRKTLKFPSTAEITDCAIHLIKSLIISPSKRLSYEDVVVHPFFKDIDFSALRQVTPPYLPPVGELDDVSNFSGGGSRTRDEAILDVSRNQTFSPIRFTKSSVQDGNVTQYTTLNNEENEGDQTVLLKHIDTGIVNDENQENINPHKLQLPSEVLKRKAIQDAAALPINEEIEEIEDIEWEGSECVRDLPFLGYTYTPGLVLFGNLSKKQVYSSAVAHVGTSITANISTPHRCTFCGHRDSSSASIRHSIGFNEAGQLNDTEKKSDSKITSLSELKQRNRQLCERIEQLQLQNKESEDLRQRLLSAFDNGHVLKEINEAVRVLSDTVVEKEKSTVGHLNSRIRQLQEENNRLTSLVQSCQQSQTIVDQIQHAVSRLSNLPSSFTEADLLDLLTALCPPTVYTTPELPTDVSISNKHSSSSSDNLIGYELVHRLINFALKQFKHASNRARQSCYALESTNSELKKALDESKQQVNQLVETIDGLIADQRRCRETENNLNWEIKELKQKLEDSKDYQRDLHQKFLQYEDKYFSARDRLREEEKKNKEITEKLERLTLNSVQRQQTSSSELQTQSGQLSLLVERNKDVERELAALRSTLQEATQQNGSELSELRKQLDSVRTEKEHLLVAKQSERRQLEERADKAETQLKSLRDQVAAMLTERGRLVSLAAIDSQRLSDMQLQLNEAIMKRETAEISLREATLRLERLNTTQSQTLILDQMRNECESTRSQLRTAQTELIHYKQNEDFLRERAANYEREISDLKQEVTLLRTRHDQLQASIALCDTVENPSEFHNHIVSLTDEKQTLKDEVDQLRTQVERLRLNNTQLLSQRDAARQEARESEMATVRAKELGEAKQQALEREVHRLSTITEQQGKLINHMRSLLPPEFNNAHRNGSVDSGSDYQNSESGKQRASKFPSLKSRRPGAPLISAASAFFNKHRKRETKLECNSKTLPTSEFTRQPSRIQKIMSKTRLNFKKHGSMPVKVDCALDAPYYTSLAGDDCYVEDYDPLGYDMYSADDADFDDGLPFPAPSTLAVPYGRPPRASDSVSNTGSTSSAPSTASSAPADPGKFIRDHSWHRNRSKIHVGWADSSDKPGFSKVPSVLKHRGQPRILKQLSKVLGRSKQSSTHLDPNQLDN